MIEGECVQSHNIVGTVHPNALELGPQKKTISCLPLLLRGLQHVPTAALQIPWFTTAVILAAPFIHYAIYTLY